MAHESLFGRLFGRREQFPDLHRQYKRVEAIFEASPFATDKPTTRVFNEIIEKYKVIPRTEPFLRALADMILKENSLFFFPDEPDWQSMTPELADELETALKAREAVCLDAEHLRCLLIKTFGEVLETIAIRQPVVSRSPFSIPFLDIFDHRALVRALYYTFEDAHKE